MPRTTRQFFEFLEQGPRWRGDSALPPPSEASCRLGAVGSHRASRTWSTSKQLEAGRSDAQGRVSGAFKSSVRGCPHPPGRPALAKSFAVEQAGEIARGPLLRAWSSELQDFTNQIDAVDLEVATFKRGELTAALQEQQPPENASGGRVEVDEEHQVWPFDGEYRRDELGFIASKSRLSAGVD